MSDEALCVIDMQKDFVGEIEHKTLIGNVLRQINKAKKLNREVIIVEYVGSGWTIPKIIKQVKDYHKLSIIQKGFEDGSPNILKTLKNLPDSGLTIRVCGVNWHQCVRNTAFGLLRAGMKVVACSNASNPDFRKGLVNCQNNWNELKEKYQDKLRII